MSLVLNTNIDSLIAQNSLTTSGNSLTTALQQLSSGLQINTAADNAAGYAIAQGMTSQINGLNTAINNANDGVSLTQTAQGSLQEITNDLQTMRDLAVQSLNATNSSQDRADLNQQFQQLQNDIQQVASNASFNGVKLLDGSFQGQTFQIGADVGQTITVSKVASMSTSALGQQYTASASATLPNGTPGNVDLSTLTINGTAVGSTTVAADAATLANAINQAGITGVTATAAANKVAGSTYTAAASATTGSITINGVSTGQITVNGTSQSADESNVVSAINAISAATGVTASITGTGAAATVTLSNTTGSNISVSYNTLTAAETGVGAANTYASTYTVNYSNTAGGQLTIADGSGTSGLTPGTTASTLSGTSVANLSVTSVGDSNVALSSIDAALQQVAAAGAQLGAFQNRFQAAITGLQTDATNLSAAKSQIVDTNYAQATSDLSKNQILQQASTAMVAQANTIPQNILTLLQKLP